MFISFEGVDGAGKSTQIDLLCQWLELQQLEFLRCREPGSTELGQKIRSLLLDHHDTSISLRAEALLFMASRAQMVDELIRPALDAEKLVVCDRYLLSTIIYQGYAGGLDIDSIFQVGQFATQSIRPDLTFVLDLPVEVSLERIGTEQDRLESRGTTYMQKVRDGFLSEAKKSPRQIQIIDAQADVNSIHQEIRSIVANALNC